MFERFTTSARAVVVGARELAADRGDHAFGTEHMLLAVVEGDTAVARALAALCLTPERVRAALDAPPAADPAAADDDGTAGAAPSDAEALRDLGIDLDAVRRRAEELFGPGALDRPVGESTRWWRRGRAARARRSEAPCTGSGRLRFTADGRKALELSLREALRLGSRDITVEHVVLGLVRAHGAATRLVSGLGVEPDDVRKAVLDLRRAA
jgi:ATP-dependent Clp protease ATP-binding subunit ClpA